LLNRELPFDGVAWAGLVRQADADAERLPNEIDGFARQ
jgi:hypothetical protein